MKTRNIAIVQIIAGLALMLPVAAFAQADNAVGGALFDISSSGSYGGQKVLVCYKGKELLVNAKKAQELFKKGATPGHCMPSGSLTITKTTTGGDGTFTFTSTNDNLKNFKITTHNGTGTITLSLAQGTYNISEKHKNGWNNTSNTCAPVTVTSGAMATCTVTNVHSKGNGNGGDNGDNSDNENENEWSAGDISWFSNHTSTSWDNSQWWN